MNDVKPSNVTLIPAAATSAQTNQGRAAESSTAAGGKQLPPVSVPEPAVTAVTTADAPRVDIEEAAEQQQKSLEEAVSQLNDYVQSTQRDLHFSFDEDAGKPVVTVLDRETQQVIRRIPDDVVLNLARKLNDDEPLRLFSAQA